MTLDGIMICARITAAVLAFISASDCALKRNRQGFFGWLCTALWALSGVGQYV